MKQPYFLMYITYLIFNSEHKFSQFLHIVKIGIFWVLVLNCTSKFFPINKEILGFFNIALAGLLNFSQVMKKIKKIGFLNIYKPGLHQIH